MTVSDRQLYVSNKSRKFFLDYDKSLVLKTECPIDVVDNGYIAVNVDTGAYGVLDSECRFVPASSCLRDNKGQFEPGLGTNADVPVYDCDAIFCGSCVAHFGHFLLEGMNRVYPALDKKYKNAKFVFANNHGAKIPQYIEPLLQGLGICSDNILYLNSTARFRRVFVPHQSLNIPRWSSVQMRDIYSAISEYYKNRITVPVYEKIYVSRGAMCERRTFGEKQIENIFRKNGFEIICPETMPLSHQIATMSHCRVLAGAAGTALHLALFMPCGGTVIQIKRNSKLKDNCAVQNMVNQTVGLNFAYVAGSIESRPSDHFSQCPQIIGVTNHMRRFFDDNNFQYTVADIEFDNSEWQLYQNALYEYNRTCGSYTSIKCKKLFVKIVSCFVPGRINRGRFRIWLQYKLGLKK